MYYPPWLKHTFSHFWSKMWSKNGSILEHPFFTTFGKRAILSKMAFLTILVKIGCPDFDPLLGLDIHARIFQKMPFLITKMAFFQKWQKWHFCQISHIFEKSGQKVGQKLLKNGSLFWPVFCQKVGYLFTRAWLKKCKNDTFFGILDTFWTPPNSRGTPNLTPFSPLFHPFLIIIFLIFTHSTHTIIISPTIPT